MCNCTSEVRVCDAPRNDGPRNFPRHCERKRSNPSGGKTSVDCFVAIAPRNDEFDPADLPAMANQIRAFGLRQINPTGKSPKVCLAPFEKIFCFAANPNHNDPSLAL
jgi:hypothetical protein